MTGVTPDPVGLGLTLAATYERDLPVSTERVWENVHDWEHLPYLHDAAFCGIDLVEAGAWGWQARVRVPPHEAPTELLIDLRLEGDTGRYHTRTLEGPGAGGDTITTVTERGARESAVRVEFWIAESDPERVRHVGDAMVALYTRLWDEDERMMLARQAFLDRRRDAARPGGSDAALDLGAADAVREDPIVDTPRGRWRVVEHGTGWIAVSATCPHAGLPLDDARVDADHVVCPWHGYRFSLVDGRNTQGHACRLPAPVRLDVDERGHLWWPAG